MKYGKNQFKEELQNALKLQGITFDTEKRLEFSDRDKKKSDISFEQMENIIDQAFDKYNEYIENNQKNWNEKKTAITKQVKAQKRFMFPQKYDLETHKNDITPIKKEQERGAKIVASTTLTIIDQNLPKKMDIEKKYKIRKALSYAVVGRFDKEFNSQFNTVVDDYHSLTTVPIKSKGGKQTAESKQEHSVFELHSLDSLQKDYSGLETLKEALEKTELVEKKTKLVKEKSELQKEKTVLETQKVDLQKQTVEISKEQKQFEQQASKMQTEQEKFKQQETTLNKQQEENRKEANKLKKEQQELVKKASEVNKNVQEEIVKKFAEERNKGKEPKQLTKEDFNKMAKNLLEIKEDLSKEIMEQQQSIEKKINDINTKQKDISKQIESIKQKQKDNDQALKQRLENRIESETNVSVKSKLQKQLNEITAKIDKEEKIEEERAELRNKLPKLKTNQSILQKGLDTLTTQKGKLTEEIKKLKTGYKESTNKQKIDKLIMSKTEELKEVETEILDRKGQITKLQNEINEAEKGLINIVDLEMKEVEAIKNMKTNDITTALNKMQLQMDSFETEVTNYENKYNDVAKKLSDPLTTMQNQLRKRELDKLVDPEDLKTEVELEELQSLRYQINNNKGNVEKHKEELERLEPIYELQQLNKNITNNKIDISNAVSNYKKLIPASNESKKFLKNVKENTKGIKEIYDKYPTILEKDKVKFDKGLEEKKKNIEKLANSIEPTYEKINQYMVERVDALGVKGQDLEAQIEILNEAHNTKLKSDVKQWDTLENYKGIQGKYDTNYLKATENVKALLPNLDNLQFKEELSLAERISYENKIAKIEERISKLENKSYDPNVKKILEEHKKKATELRTQFQTKIKEALPEIDQLKVDEKDDLKALVDKEYKLQQIQEQMNTLYESDNISGDVKDIVHDHKVKAHKLEKEIANNIGERRSTIKVSFAEKVKGSEWKDITYRKLKQMYKNNVKELENNQEYQSQYNIQDTKTKIATSFQDFAYKELTKNMTHKGSITEEGKKQIKAQLEKFAESMYDNNQKQADVNTDKVHKGLIAILKAVGENIKNYFAQLKQTLEVRKEVRKSRKFTEKIAEAKSNVNIERDI